jgi:cell division protein FtsB
MTIRRCTWTKSLTLLAFAMLLRVGVAHAGASSRASASNQALERRLDLLEQQNKLLEEQNRTIQSQLTGQKAEIDSLKGQLQTAVAPIATLQAEMPKLQDKVAYVEKRSDDVPFSVGFRTGWGESPYDMPGGFYYGAYLNHKLLTEEDGIPGGFVSGELAAGVVLGNAARTNGNLVGILTGTSAKSWMDTIEIQPTVQYHLDLKRMGLPSLETVKPYLLAGPGMWINLLSTPIVVKNKVPSNGYRHYDADFQGGGVFGLGVEASLGSLSVAPIQKILNKSFVGAEWRYNQFGNGEAFQQYTGTVGFGW